MSEAEIPQEILDRVRREWSGRIWVKRPLMVSFVAKIKPLMEESTKMRATKIIDSLNYNHECSKAMLDKAVSMAEAHETDFRAHDEVMGQTELLDLYKEAVKETTLLLAAVKQVQAEHGSRKGNLTYIDEVKS